MSTFDDRETAFEAKFAHDADLQFKARVRANKMLGLWAAQKLGLDEQAAQDYATTIVKTDLAETGDGDVFAKLSTDLAGKTDDDTLRAQMKSVMAQAMSDISD